MNLSNFKIESVIRSYPNISQYSYSDGEGLSFRIDEGTGRSTFVLRTTFKGTRKKFTLGSYPQISLAEARTAKDIIINNMKKGHDPVDVWKSHIGTKDQPRLDDVAMELYNNRIVPFSTNPKNFLSTLRVHISPNIGKKPIDDIRVSDVETLMAKLQGQSTAGIVLTTIKKIVSYAQQHRLIKDSQILILTNSDFGIKARRGGKPLAKHDIAPFFADAITQGICREYRILMALYLVTLVRKIELLGAEKSEFDLDNGIWHLPASRVFNGKEIFSTKTNQSIAIPLPNITILWIKELFSYYPKSPYLMPAKRRCSSPTINASTLNKAFKGLFKQYNCNVHGKRHTGTAIAKSLNIEKPIRELCLNHRDKQQYGDDAHDHYLLFEERKHSHTLIAEHIANQIPELNSVYFLNDKD